MIRYRKDRSSETLRPVIDEDVRWNALQTQLDGARRRRRLALAAGAVSALALLGGGIWAASDRDREPALDLEATDPAGLAPNGTSDEQESTPTQATTGPASATQVEIVATDWSPGSVHPGPVRTVRIHTTIIDDGRGPRLCIGGVESSLPPQCDGPLLTGLDQAGWGESQGDAHWGDRELVVDWPLRTDEMVVISQGPPNAAIRVDPPLPTECANLGPQWRSSSDIGAYAQRLGPENGGVWMAEGGILVLQVLGDLEAHRGALQTESQDACVVPTERSRGLLLTVQASLGPLVRDPTSGAISTTPNGSGGKVDVGVYVADERTVNSILALVEDPDSIRLITTATAVN